MATSVTMLKDQEQIFVPRQGSLKIKTLSQTKYQLTFFTNSRVGVEFLNTKGLREYLMRPETSFYIIYFLGQQVFYWFELDNIVI